MKVVTFVSHFGIGSGYIAQMKVVVLNNNSQVSCIDISHTIPPQQIHSETFVLQSAAPYFPRGTIHIAVVDPGVVTFLEVQTIKVIVIELAKIAYEVGGVLYPRPIDRVVGERIVVEHGIWRQGYHGTRSNNHTIAIVGGVRVLYGGASTKYEEDPIPLVVTHLTICDEIVVR